MADDVQLPPCTGRLTAHPEPILTRWRATLRERLAYSQRVAGQFWNWPARGLPHFRQGYGPAGKPLRRGGQSNTLGPSLANHVLTCTPVTFRLSGQARLQYTQRTNSHSRNQRPGG